MKTRTRAGKKRKLVVNEAPAQNSSTVESLSVDNIKQNDLADTPTSDQDSSIECYLHDVPDEVPEVESEESFTKHIISPDQKSGLSEQYKTVSHFSWSKLHSFRYLARIKNSSPPKSTVDKLVENLKNFKTGSTNNDELQEKYNLQLFLVQNWTKLCRNQCKKIFNPMQNELFALLTSYSDLHFPCTSYVEKLQTIQPLYCLHILRHLLRSQSQILRNNATFANMATEEKEQSLLRDQGFVKPKVLILLPFRHQALQVIDFLLSLLQKKSRFEVSYKRRFKQEFGDTMDSADAEEINKKMLAKPNDYQILFAGNTEEHFQIGIRILGSGVRLYAPFYSSDIIVASPLGLRKTIGEKGESHHEYDFLSSIELMIVDLADVYLMQNWEHILHIKKHMHLRPKESHGTDFSRVYNWALDGNSKHYCQTAIFSGICHPQIYSVLTLHSFNYKGLIMVDHLHEKASICGIPAQLPQMFHKLANSNQLREVPDERFNFFVSNLMKTIKTNKSSHTMIFIPQYYDFVRVRNHMRREMKEGSGPKFSFICEYSDDKTVGKARRNFLMGRTPILLYTERYHFYHRPFLRGIRRIVFYELPTYAHFYSEICNMIHRVEGDTDLSSASVSALYSRYDSDKLAAVVGKVRCNELIKSQKETHMFLTGAPV